MQECSIVIENLSFWKKAKWYLDASYALDNLN